MDKFSISVLINVVQLIAIAWLASLIVDQSTKPIDNSDRINELKASQAIRQLKIDSLQRIVSDQDSLMAQNDLKRAKLDTLKIRTYETIDKIDSTYLLDSIHAVLRERIRARLNRE